jgi:hypothetical protein
MAGTYRPLGDGGFLIETPAGALRTALNEEQLIGAGYEPYAGATAFVGDTDQSGGAGGARSVTDVPREVPGAAPPRPSPEQLAAQDALARGITDPWEAAQVYDVDPQATADFMQEAQSGRLPQSGAGGTTGAGGGGGVQVAAAVPVAGGVGAAPVVGPGATGSPRPGNTLRNGSTVEDIDLADQVANGQAAPPPRARFIKTGGKDIRAGFQVQKSGISDPEREALKEGLAENEIDQRLGMVETGRREQHRLQQRAEDFEGNEFADAQEAVRKQRERTQWINTEVAKRQQDIQRERKAVEKLEVSPERVYQDGGVWLRIGAAISMIAGGMLQGRRGGNNPGLEAVNQILQDGMDSQRENRAARERGVATRETELDRLTQLYGSPETAEAELRKRQLDYAEAYAKKFALETGSQDVMMRVQQTFAERDRERMLENAKLDQDLRDRVTESWAYQPERVVQVGGGGPAKPKAIERMVRVPGGGYGWARDSTSARDVQGKITTNANIANTLKKMKALAEDGTLTDLEKRAKYEAYKQDIDAEINVAKGQGAMGVEEGERMTKLTGDPSVVLNPQNSTRLDIAIRQTDGRNSGLIRDYLHADPDATQPLTGGRPQSARSEE